MFDHPRHTAIAAILDGLDTRLLTSAHCYFAGGTAMVMRFGEWRVSDDIDFLVSDWNGYKHLRELIVADSIAALGQGLVALREIVADRYGIRTLLDSAAGPVKFEIIHEGRINLDPPGTEDTVRRVQTLTTADMVASKLLANDDRWADRGLFSRDILDLALLPWSTGDWNRGHHKAIRAYGSSIDTSLHRARAELLDHHRRLPDCMDALHITTVTEQQMRQRLLALPV